MTTKNYEIEALFAEPFFRTNIGHAISAKQVEYIKNLKMDNNQLNLISDNLYLLEEPEMKSIKKAIQDALNIYAREVMGITQKLYVTQSWSLTNNPGVGMHGHSHSNSIVSGSLYFAELPQPSPRMVFDRHNTYQRLELKPVQGQKNIYNTPMNTVTPNTHDLLLFPSDLQHFVEVNNASQPRHSIAFNTFIKGTLGSYKDVSELTLK